MLFRRLRPTEWAFDVALALGVAFVALPFIGVASLPLVDAIVVVITAAGVVLRRASPPLALVIVSIGAIVQMLSGAPPTTVNFGQLFVIYACAAFGSRLMRRVALAAAVVGAVASSAYIVVVQMMVVNELESLTLLIAIAVTFGFSLAVLVCAWLLGLARHLVLRARQASVAQQIAEVEADRDRERVAVELERGRVAREMHDVLAHSLVSIAMLADGTRISVRADPDEAEDLASTIGDLARESVTDVRRLLAELRHGQSDTAAPTISELPGVIGRVESLGLTVDRTDRGEPRPLTPGASLAAYRVVSECLTNALRHGDVRQGASLVLEWQASALHVTVRNRVAVPDAPGDAPAPGATERGTVPIPTGGHGLLGIRERVLLEAGTIDVRREGDTFVVAVVLPAGTDARSGEGGIAQADTVDAQADAGHAQPDTANAQGDTQTSDHDGTDAPRASRKEHA